jgi:hypothetical protein
VISIVCRQSKAKLISVGRLAWIICRDRADLLVLAALTFTGALIALSVWRRSMPMSFRINIRSYLPTPM